MVKITNSSVSVGVRLFFAALLGSMVTGCVSTPSKNADIDYAKYSESRDALASELGEKEEYEFALDLAQMAVERKRYDRAEVLLQKLRKVNQQDVRSYRLLAKIYEAQGKIQYARVSMQEAIKQPTKTVDDESEFARLSLMLSDYVSAEEIYQAWLLSNEASRQISALNNLGFSQLLQKDYPLAQTYFEQALQKDPLSSKARNNLQLLKTLME